MSSGKGPATHDEAFWHDYLTNPNGMQASGRRVFSRIPSHPRCRLCAMPFAGPGGRMLRLAGKRPSDHNPNVCNSCQTFMTRHHGGAEVNGSLLFADIRGSTELAETMSPAEYHALLDRFYTVASDVVVGHNGIVDKFVGDEVVAVFPPMLSNGRHAASAVEAARALLIATGHAEGAGPWLRVGAAVHTGRVWFGAVGEGSYVEMTVLGDPVNTTARFAAIAGAGEILVSEAAASEAGLDPALELRALDLKGKEHPTQVVTLRVGPEGAPASSSG